VVSPRQIGAADRALKQRIADDREALRGVEECHASRRMARHMQYLQHNFPDRNLITLVEPAVRDHVTRVLDPKTASRIGEAFQQKQITAVGSLDWDPEPLL